mmetsp:Transcript_31929/g.104404  ORF Transcript_31929/g.104404 Transcript_31929/m.104404 type:complete len:353 (+) Transcript_31929:1262-2320(+)
MPGELHIAEALARRRGLACARPARARPRDDSRRRCFRRRTWRLRRRRRPGRQRKRLAAAWTALVELPQAAAGERNLELRLWLGGLGRGGRGGGRRGEGGRLAVRRSGSRGGGEAVVIVVALGPAGRLAALLVDRREHLCRSCSRFCRLLRLLVAEPREVELGSAGLPRASWRSLVLISDRRRRVPCVATHGGRIAPLGRASARRLATALRRLASLVARVSLPARRDEEVVHLLARQPGKHLGHSSLLAELDRVDGDDPLPHLELPVLLRRRPGRDAHDNVSLVDVDAEALVRAADGDGALGLVPPQSPRHGRLLARLGRAQLRLRRRHRPPNLWQRLRREAASVPAAPAVAA